MFTPFADPNSLMQACPATVAPSVAASDLARQFSRRLDWRFLLPDHVLRNVAYFGEPSDLLFALRMFSESATLLTDDDRCLPYRLFDLVALRYPSVETVGVAGNAARPGGHIYIELLGALNRARNLTINSRKMAGIMKYVRALRDAGCDDVQAYWYHPSFDDCREIIPLFDSKAVRYALSREGPIHLARETKLIASRCLFRTGLLQHFIPCYSLIAHKRKDVPPYDQS